MDPFKKLLYNKRGKMLILTIFLIAFALPQSKSINLTYIVKNNDGLEIPSCIAEEDERYGGLGWIFPINNSATSWNMTTKFIPTIESNFNCKFSDKEKCTRNWTIKDYWEIIDTHSTRSYDLILDERWDEFPTIFTDNNTEFKHRFEIPNQFHVGFSIRSDNFVELLICEGWQPSHFPCYHFNITMKEIHLRKIASYTSKIATENVLDYYSVSTDILSQDEWRSFVISFDKGGILRLDDVTKNRTVIQYHDNKEHLKPIYILAASQSPALWKIHKNQFLHTKTAQTSRFDPSLDVNSKDLCISLHVSMCDNCKMSFLRKSERDPVIFLKEIGPSNNLYDWSLVKLKEENIKSDKEINIYVRTEFVDNNANGSDGFWAMDNVRICHENEVKVSFLKYQAKKEEDVTCQMVQHPNRRPAKYSYPQNNGFQKIESTANETSIKLNWTQEDPHHILNYFITYKANDICESAPFNAKRLKSAGFLMTKHDEITLGNLVAYTKYNITFSSILHENEQNIFATTSESPYPTEQELPKNVQMVPTSSNSCRASWLKVDCSALYGHILYSLTVINTANGKSKEFDIQTENYADINDLEPFTTYTLKIVTARTFGTIQNGIAMNINCTTQSGIADQVQNLQVYATGSDSVSFRYELPSRTTGIPKDINITRCNEALGTKCKTSVANVQPCAVFPGKYCTDLNYLRADTKYIFKVSLRNVGTDYFGNETVIKATTEERVPGQPTNVTYKMVDCQNVRDAICYLNISWRHPFDQNGSITAFNIILNRTETKENIHEILQINNKTYTPIYEYQIKHIPYSATYDLYVQSVNYLYKSKLTHIRVKTHDIVHHVDQEPILIENNEDSLTYKLPPVDHKLKSYKLTIFVQDFDKNITIPDKIKNMNKISRHLCHNFGNTWVLEPLEVDNKTENITIGKNKGLNVPINPGTQYCVTFIVTNIYEDKEHDVTYFSKLKTPTETPKSTTETDDNNLHYYLLLLLLLLLIPLGFSVQRCIQKRKARKPIKTPENHEHEYETLPFDDYKIDNSVSNANYDQLLHK